MAMTGVGSAKSRAIGDRKLHANNSSGLTGIWFLRRLSSGKRPYWFIAVFCSYTDSDGKFRRTSFMLTRGRTQEEALILAIATRLKFRMPVPTLAEATAALQKFIDANPLAIAT